MSTTQNSLKKFTPEIRPPPPLKNIRFKASEFTIRHLSCCWTPSLLTYSRVRYPVLDASFRGHWWMIGGPERFTKAFAKHVKEGYRTFAYVNISIVFLANGEILISQKFERLIQCHQCSQQIRCRRTVQLLKHNHDEPFHEGRWHRCMYIYRNHQNKCLPLSMNEIGWEKSGYQFWNVIWNHLRPIIE